MARAGCARPSRAAAPVTSAIAHDPSGAVTGWTYGNGIVHSRSRDTDGRLTGISSVHGGTVYQSLTYGRSVGFNDGQIHQREQLMRSIKKSASIQFLSVKAEAVYARVSDDGNVRFCQ